jgi:diaminopimelate decarboxylase
MTADWLNGLANAVGTPAYVYDLAELRAAHADLLAALPMPSRLYYSVKANPHPLVGGVLAGLGCAAEVSSTGEVDAAIDAGFPAATTILNGPAKSGGILDHALAAGIRRFSVDSPVDLDRVARHARTHQVTVDYLLRVNADTPVPGMGLSMTGTATQFGADASWIAAEPAEFASRPGAEFAGLHLYMGTHLETEDLLVRQFDASIALAAKLGVALGAPVREIDLGGGFGMAYARAGNRMRFTGLRAALTESLDAQWPGWRSDAPVVSFESGRYLAGGCGRLLCRVQDVKTSKGRVQVVLDAGINQLGGMSGLRRVPRIVPDLVLVGPESPGVFADCSVVGPLCTPLDAWSQGVTMPEVRPGDLLMVPNVGAYGLTAGLLGFLSHPAAVEVIVDGREVVSVSRLRLVREGVDNV